MDEQLKWLYIYLWKHNAKVIKVICKQNYRNWQYELVNEGCYEIEFELEHLSLNLGRRVLIRLKEFG